MDNKKLNVPCPTERCAEKSSHNSKTAKSNLFPPNVDQTLDKSLKTKSLIQRRTDKLGDNHHKNTVLIKIHPEGQEERLLRINTSVYTPSNSQPSFLPNHGNLARPSQDQSRRPGFPLTFLRQKTSSSSETKFYTLIAFQLLIIIVTNQCFVQCNGQLQEEQSNDNLFYSQDIDQDTFPTQDLTKLYQLYQDTSTTSDDFARDFREFSEEPGKPGEKELQFVGCLFSNDVCTQDEICFDDLILGRCISADSEIDEDEGLQPLSTDDQTLLDAEVERLLEQGFRWDDPYTQCVLQTLIGSFRYYGLEYDTTLCKAAFLPELSIERRVDVPKKFILPDVDVDSTNHNNVKLFNEASDDEVSEDEVEQQPLSASGNEEKRSNDKSKRNNNNAIFLAPPAQSGNADNGFIQVDQPSFYGSPLPTYSEDQEDDYNNFFDELGVEERGPPSFQYPSMNFLIRQEEDGGILIEPASAPASSGNQNQPNNNDNQDEESDFVIPSYLLQPSPTIVEANNNNDAASSYLPVIQIPQKEQIANLLWMANNIQEPYEEQNYDNINDLGIMVPTQQQQNPLTFHPAVWLDDDASILSNGNLDFGNQFDAINIDPDFLNINYPMTTFDGEEGNDRALEAESNFSPTNFNLDDYMVPISDMASINKRNVANNDDEEELLYVPVYSDPDGQFLNRHKFSTLSKRSMDNKPQEEVEEFQETYEYPVVVSVDGKEVPSVHYTRHEAEEPSGLRDDVDVYEPTLRDDKDTSGLYNKVKDFDYELDSANTNPEEEELSESGEDEHDNENSLGSFTFNRKERLDVKKPGPDFPNSENNFFFKKLLDLEDEKTEKKRPDTSKNLNDVKQAAILGDPFGPRRSNYSADGKGQIEVEFPLQVLNPDPKKRNLADDNPPRSEQKEFVHLMMKKRFDKWQDGMDFVDFLADEFGVPRHALDNPRIDDHHVQFRVDPNPQNIDAEKMAYDLENDIILKKRISNQLGLEVGEAAAGDRNDYEVSKFPANSISNLLYIALVATSTLAILILSAAILILTKHCVRRRREHAALNKVHKQDVLESERGKVQEEYKQLCRDWSKKNTTNAVQPDSSPKSSLMSDGSKSGNQPSSTTIKKLQGQDSKESSRSSTSSWGEEPTSTNMDISTGHMVLAYMEDHLKNKQRLEQEWVALCGYEAEPCATTLAFKTENKKKNRYPDKLPYDHNRVILNAVLNGSNSDYINASSVTDHDPRNPSYIVTQGPLAQTVADFWQMIWEQGCVVIVMLSRLQDNGYQLCHRYWPEEGSEQYHIFEVHLVSEHVWCDDYLVRSVYLKNTRTGETRTVTQFHFRSWPAQSVPSSTKALLEFRRKVNKSYRGRSAPICVHCSDGVGRAGTYVLIDMVLNRMAKGCKEIDIAATLEHIRDQRSGMVQTRPQFEFCLMAVAEEVHAILKALLP